MNRRIEISSFICIPLTFFAGETWIHAWEWSSKIFYSLDYAPIELKLWQCVFKRCLRFHCFQEYWCWKSKYAMSYWVFKYFWDGRMKHLKYVDHFYYVRTCNSFISNFTDLTNNLISKTRMHLPLSIHISRAFKFLWFGNNPTRCSLGTNYKNWVWIKYFILILLITIM